MNPASLGNLVDQETLDRLVVAAIMLLGISMMVTAVVGEVLGWWNDFGELLGVAGLMTTVVGGGFGFFRGARTKDVLAVGLAVHGVRDDVRHVGEDVRQVGEDVRHVGEGVRQVGQDVRAASADSNLRLDALQEHMAQQTAILTQIRDRL